MKFWKRLRWIASIAFAALLIASWLLADPQPSGSAIPQGRPAPLIVR